MAEETTTTPSTKRASRKQVKVACVPCRKAKVACSTGRPCNRCIKKRIPEELCVNAPQQSRKRRRRQRKRGHPDSTATEEGPSYKRQCLSSSSGSTPFFSIPFVVKRDANMEWMLSVLQVKEAPSVAPSLVFNFSSSPSLVPPPPPPIDTLRLPSSPPT